MQRLLAFIAVVGLVTVPALADWNPGEPYKMHFPQLPDPEGWDVYAVAPKVLADDWRCTETGPVDDIHFWGSWREDRIGKIAGILVSIHDNIPGPPFSQPGQLLWAYVFSPGQWKEREYGTGKQGWFNPNTGQFQKPDHQRYFQYNITGIKDPFTQEQGKIYWLDISVLVVDPGTEWGWKTSRDHWMDDAVWGDLGVPGWHELRDPIPPHESLDLAFVITPEPASLLLLGLGLFALRRR